MPLNFIRNFIPEFNESEAADIGFGDQMTTTSRLIKSDGSFNINKKGSLTDNLYEHLIEMSWGKFLLGLTAFFFLSNSIFAGIILINDVTKIDGIVEGSFLENFAQALYFSIQTFTTVGYGHLTPIGTFTNLLAALIAFSGLLTFAISTGLFFARFSRPVSHIIFTDNILIAPNKEGTNSLQFRIANGTNSQLIDVEARVTLTWLEQKDGKPRRKFQRLDLEIEKIFMFPLNWTIVHPINDVSPLYKQSLASLKGHHLEILILIRAYDETYDHYIYTKRSYVWDDIKEDVQFVTMYDTVGTETILHLDRLNETIPADILQEKEEID